MMDATTFHTDKGPECRRCGRRSFTYGLSPPGFPGLLRALCETKGCGHVDTLPKPDVPIIAADAVAEYHHLCMTTLI